MMSNGWKALSVWVSVGYTMKLEVRHYAELIPPDIGNGFEILHDTRHRSGANFGVLSGGASP